MTSANLLNDALAAARLAWSRLGTVDRVVPAAARDAVSRDNARESFDLDEAAAELAAELRPALRAALDAAGFSAPPPGTPDEATALDGDVLTADERFARYLEALGDEGGAVAEAVRTNARARWAAFSASRLAAGRELWSLWTADDARFAVNLAWALWIDRVRARVIEAHDKPAALIRPVYTDLLGLHSWSSSRTFDQASRSLRFDGRELATLHEGDGGPSAFTPSMDLRVIEGGLALLGSVAAHRLLRWEVLEAHKRALRGAADPRLLVVDGGWAALTNELRLPRKDEHRVRQIALAQAMWRFELPDGSRGNLIQVTERPARGQRRARVEIVVGPQLLPSYVFELGRGPGAPERKLVPMLRRDPPFSGARNHRGPQLTMALGVVGEMRSRARELAAEGSLTLTIDDWIRLGDRAGIPRRRAMVVAIRDAWVRGDARAPPLLVEVSPDRFRLAGAHASERTFIEAGGRAELAHSAAAKSSVARRRHRLAAAPEPEEK